MGMERIGVMGKEYEIQAQFLQIDALLQNKPWEHSTQGLFTYRFSGHVWPSRIQAPNFKVPFMMNEWPGNEQK